ncbi:MAG: NAD(P)/FAD-dependent oxidoreductase [Candidatus Schekmanbacteria bacterium]|nr:NAD(P)/FAD-dependent oxidoreductase [Candidatus Schekmanbacteria bacterium]
MTEKSFDIAVAGAGPCGLMAAKKLSAKGFKVAVVDRKPFASFINPGIMEMLSLQPNRVSVDDSGIYFPESGFTLPKYSIKNEIYGFATYSPGKQSLRLRSHFPTNYRIDYPYWIEKLEKEARNFGASLFYGFEVVSLIKEKERVIGLVAENKDSSQLEIKAHHLVAADGIRSKISRFAGIKKEHWGAKRIAGLKFKDFDISLTSRSEFFNPAFHNMYLDKKFSGPNTLALAAYLGDGEMYTIADINDHDVKGNSSYNPVDCLENFLSFLNKHAACAEAFSKARPYKRFCAYLPISSPIAEPFAMEGISFIGDTAFTIETQWAGAMAIAARAAETIEKILVSDGAQESIESYNKWWGRYVKNARKQVDFSTFMHSLDEEELNELFGIFSEEIVIEHLEGSDDMFGTPNEYIKNMYETLLSVNPSEIKSQKVKLLVSMLLKRGEELQK